jgi:YjbR
MTPAGFRRIALALKDTVEHMHHDHPDFRVGGRIFATLGYPNGEWGMVVLTPEQQRERLRDYPDAFMPVKGAWGEKGCTTVRLAAVEDEALGEALTLARQNAVAKGPTRPARPTARGAKKRPIRRSKR